MMFFRKPSPELTNDAYARWLRAQRPPLVMFLAMSELEQEALANIGDEHVAEEAMALAYAINPSLVPQEDREDAPIAPTQSEESMAVRLAKGLIERLGSQKAPTPPVPVKMPTETLSGFGDRRSETHVMPERPKLFGKEPDEVMAP